MGDYCQKCRSLEKGWDLFQREKKNKCSFEHVEFKILLRHLFGNFHEALKKFSKSFLIFTEKSMAGLWR